MRTHQSEDDWRKPVIVVQDAVLNIPDGKKAAFRIQPKSSVSDMKLVIRAGEGCVVDIMCIMERPCGLSIASHVGAHSAVSCYGLWLKGGQGRMSYSLEGEKAQAHDVQLFIADGSANLKLHTRLDHVGRGTSGEMATRGVVKDQASAGLSGMIRILKSGAGAESFLSEHAMLLSPDARASANPELEIDNNDVASRHSASVSRIDEKKVFYLMSRGLTRRSASALIVEGFMDSAIEKIRPPRMRDMISSKALGAL